MMQLSAQLEEKKALKKKLLAVFQEEMVGEDDYQQATADYTRQIEGLERQLRELSNITASTDAFVRFAQLQLRSMQALESGER